VEQDIDTTRQTVLGGKCRRSGTAQSTVGQASAPSTARAQETVPRGKASEGARGVSVLGRHSQDSCPLPAVLLQHSPPEITLYGDHGLTGCERSGKCELPQPRDERAGHVIPATGSSHRSQRRALMICFSSS